MQTEAPCRAGLLHCRSRCCRHTLVCNVTAEQIWYLTCSSSLQTTHTVRIATVLVSLHCMVAVVRPIHESLQSGLASKAARIACLRTSPCSKSGHVPWPVLFWSVSVR